jgi:hypothetical protein
MSRTHIGLAVAVIASLFTVMVATTNQALAAWTVWYRLEGTDGRGNPQVTEWQSTQFTAETREECFVKAGNVVQNLATVSRTAMASKPGAAVVIVNERAYEIRHGLSVMRTVVDCIGG